MADFAEGISDDTAGRRLARAIRGRGAFRRFRDELHEEYPDLVSVWHAFRDTRAKRTCGRKAGFCPQRRNTRPPTGSVKSKAGRRTVGLPAQLVALLRKHRGEQDAEHKLARQLWREEGWVFATPGGQALNHMTDYKEWKALLKAAGLREARLHDARHTAATVLLILGQPERTVMSLMGWSTTDMATRYQHVTDEIRAQVASQVDGLIWEARTDDAATRRSPSSGSRWRRSCP